MEDDKKMRMIKAKIEREIESCERYIKDLKEHNGDKNAIIYTGYEQTTLTNLLAYVKYVENLDK